MQISLDIQKAHQIEEELLLLLQLFSKCHTSFFAIMSKAASTNLRFKNATFNHTNNDNLLGFTMTD